MREFVEGNSEFNSSFSIHDDPNIRNPTPLTGQESSAKDKKARNINLELVQAQSEVVDSFSS